DSVTTLPGAPFPFASCRGRVMVVLVCPSAETVVGAATIPPAAAGGDTKLTLAVFVSWRGSVVSVAVNVTSWIWAFFTVNATAPEWTSDTPLAGEITTLPLGVAVSVTVLPLTGKPLASKRFTCTRPVVSPSAGTGAPARSGGGGGPYRPIPSLLFWRLSWVR